MVLASLLWEISPYLKEFAMIVIRSAKRFENKSVCIYKYTDVQSGDVEYTFWEDKYEEDVFYGRKTVQELVVEDFCVEDPI